MLLLAQVFASGCAGLGSDVHLAPLYTRLHAADGGTVVEALGGLYRHHGRDDEREWFTVGPLYGIEHELNGDYMAHLLFPLGKTRHTNGETLSLFVPLYLWTDKPERGVQTKTLVTIIGFMMEKREDGSMHFGWFPFLGRFEDVLTFERIVFVLWPLFIYAERDGRVSYHFLWPFFGWTYGGGEKSWHVFPLFARATIEDRYDRTYVLWPIFHWQKNDLGGGGEQPERVWWVWPLLGHKSVGTFDAWTTLWPLFGYSRDPRSGYWALDFPFPFVRIQRGGKEEGGTRFRTRFWPFYSHVHAEGLDAKSFLWPFIHVRHETGRLAERDAVYLLPFWQTWDRTDKETGETSAYRKLWPLFMREREGEWRSGALLELDPFFRNRVVPRYLTGFFRLYEWEGGPERKESADEGEEFRRERSFLGLYRREKGRGEDRRSIAGLWAKRRFREDGKTVRETSLLFGLVRWRVTRGEGFDMLPPALPGPGWPEQTQPSEAVESRTFF